MRETKRDGFERRSARRALKDAVRFSTSAGGRDSAAGVFGRMTGAMRSVQEDHGREERRTAFAEEVEVALVCLLALTLAGFLELTGFVSRHSSANVERPAVQDKVLGDRG